MAQPEHPARGHLFSEGDLRLFRLTAVISAWMLLTGLILIIIWTLAYLVGMFANLITPLAVAGVIALVLHPVVRFLEKRLHLPRLLAVSALFLVAAVGLGTLLVVVVPTAIDQARDFIEAIPGMIRNWRAKLEFTAPGLLSTLLNGLEDMDLSNLTSGLEGTAGRVAGRIMSYVGMAVGLAFVPLYLFFALMSGDRLPSHAREVLSVFRSDTQQDIMYLGSLFVEYVTAFFRGQLLIAMIMGSLLAIGFTLVGLQAAIIIGLILGFLNIVPFLGTIVGLATVVPVAYIQPDGGLQTVALVLVVFAVVQWIEGWFLTPKIMADRSGLHPAVVVISIFFWGTVLGGIIGMILAVPLTAFVIAVWHHLKHRFARTVVAESDVAEVPLDDRGR